MFALSSYVSGSKLWNATLPASFHAGHKAALCGLMRVRFGFRGRSFCFHCLGTDTVGDRQTQVFHFVRLARSLLCSRQKFPRPSTMYSRWKHQAASYALVSNSRGGGGVAP
jgi:hypothetical protein